MGFLGRYRLFSMTLPGTIAQVSATLLFSKWVDVVALTLWITGFLCILNIGLAIAFRKKHTIEIVTYGAACAIELAIFTFAFLFHLGIISQIPYHLPPGLSFDRAELGAAISIGIGLFPAAYWHRASLSSLRARMAQDAQVMKDRDGGVRVRKTGPGEWMN